MVGWSEGITFAIALLGAVLGLLNTWIAIDQRRVRLRVSPAYALTPNVIGFSIAVTNLSAFPLTISEVGLALPGRKESRCPRQTCSTEKVGPVGLNLASL